MAKIKASLQFHRCSRNYWSLVAARTIVLNNLLSVASLMAQERQSTFDSLEQDLVPGLGCRVLRSNHAGEDFGIPP